MRVSMVRGQRYGVLTTVLVAAVTAQLGACTGSSPVDANASSSPAVSPPSVQRNVVYAAGSSKRLLDLHLPARSAAPAPLVIWVHGGGFRVGDKASLHQTYDPASPTPSVAAACGEVVQVQAPSAAALNARGYAVAAINYRLEDNPIIAVQDAKAAVRFLRANASRYHLDPDRFAAWGDSAGGYIVVMLGVTGGTQTRFDDPALADLAVPATVQAVVDWFGSTSLEARGLNGPQESPFTYIKAERPLPPFMIAHGDADCVVPLEHSLRLHEALAAAGKEVKLDVLPGAAHEDPVFMRTLLEPTYAFLTRAFGR